MPAIISKHMGDMLFTTRVGQHEIINDVPLTPDWGGKDRYPTPPDYFVASIASCIAAFVVQYCTQVGLDASDLAVELSYEKETKPAHFRDLAVTITLPNAKLGSRLEAIKRVASHCTVHETISRMGDLAITVVDKSE